MIDIDNTLMFYLGTDEKQELDEFKKWAFGPLYEQVNLPVLYFDFWNMHHKEDLQLVEEGLLFDDLKDMVAIYKEKQ